MNLLTQIKREPAYLVQIILLAVILIVFYFVMGNQFFNQGSLSSILSQLPIITLLSLGMAVSMISGGINLSIVSGANASALACAYFMTSHAESSSYIFMGLFAGLFVSIMIGLANGIIISYFRASPILVTLGTMVLISGLNIQISGGKVISGFPPSIQAITNSSFLGLPYSILILIAAFVFIYIILNKTALGKSIYLIGKNEKSSFYSGINVSKITIIVYIISSLFGFLAAIMMMSQFNSAKAGYGESYLLTTILACVLGGLNPDGGFGRIAGVFISLIILQLIESGFNILGISSQLTMAIWGITLIAFIFIKRILFKS